MNHSLPKKNFILIELASGSLIIQFKKNKTRAIMKRVWCFNDQQNQHWVGWLHISLSHIADSLIISATLCDLVFRIVFFSFQKWTKKAKIIQRRDAEIPGIRGIGESKRNRNRNSIDFLWFHWLCNRSDGFFYWTGGAVSIPTW